MKNKPMSPEHFRNYYKAKGRRIVKRTEDDVQLEVCKYIATAYPGALFISDIAGRNLSIEDRSAYKMRSQKINKDGKFEAKSFPDLLVFNPMTGFVGLALELKNEGVILTKKDGTLRKNEHVESQYECLLEFKQLGWCVSFAIGFQQAKKLIDEYFAGNGVSELLIIKTM